MKPAMKHMILILIAAAVLTLVIRITLVSKQAKPTQYPVQILMTNSDLPAGFLLRNSEYSWKEVAANAVPKNAIVRNSAEAQSLPGSLLRKPLSKGSTLTANDIISPNAWGFLAAALKPGMRAVSVAVNDVSGNAGLIQPGDFVDLLLTQNLRDQQTPASSMVSETIATGLRVIAVGSVFQRPKDNEQLSPNLQARTITLEVTPHAAESVTLATRLGELSLALRSFAVTRPGESEPKPEASTPANNPVWAGDISQALRPVTKTRSTVQVLRGSSNAQENPGSRPGGNTIPR